MLAIGSGGEYEEIGAKVEGDYLTFETDDLTFFAIATPKAQVKTNSEIPTYIWIIVASVVFMAGVVSLAIYAVRKKKRMAV